MYTQLLKALVQKKYICKISVAFSRLQNLLDINIVLDINKTFQLFWHCWRTQIPTSSIADSL